LLGETLKISLATAHVIARQMVHSGVEAVPLLLPEQSSNNV
jgi:hypothetical protein